MFVLSVIGSVVVAVMGGGQRTCGENKSRSSLELPGHQNQLLKELKATGKPVILVLINGRPLSINWAAANLDAIVEAWYPGAHSKGCTLFSTLTFLMEPSFCTTKFISTRPCILASLHWAG